MSLLACPSRPWKGSHWSGRRRDTQIYCSPEDRALCSTCTQCYIGCILDWLCSQEVLQVRGGGERERERRGERESHTVSVQPGKQEALRVESVKHRDKQLLNRLAVVLCRFVDAHKTWNTSSPRKTTANGAHPIHRRKVKAVWTTPGQPMSDPQPQHTTGLLSFALLWKVGSVNIDAFRVAVSRHYWTQPPRASHSTWYDRMKIHTLLCETVLKNGWQGGLPQQIVIKSSC